MSNLKENIKAAQIDLIKELGIDTLEPKQKEELLLQIGEILQQRIVLRIVEELPEEKQDEFNSILEKAQDKSDLLDQYLEENIPGVEEMILEEVGKYKKEASVFMKQALTKNSDEEKKAVLREEATAETEVEKPVAEIVPEASVEKTEEAEVESKPEVLKENLMTAEVEKKNSNGLEETEEMKALKADIEKMKAEDEINASKNLEENNNLEANKAGNVPKKEIKVEAEVPKKEIEAETLKPEKSKIEKSDETTKISTEEDDLIKVDEQADFRIGAKPIEKIQTELDSSTEKKQVIEAPAVSTGIEQEQADQETQILEENKVDNNQVEGEELDLSNEIGKMSESDSEEEMKKE